METIDLSVKIYQIHTYKTCFHILYNFWNVHGLDITSQAHIKKDHLYVTKDLHELLGQ